MYKATGASVAVKKKTSEPSTPSPVSLNGAADLDPATGSQVLKHFGLRRQDAHAQMLVSFFECLSDRTTNVEATETKRPYGGAT